MAGGIYVGIDPGVDGAVGVIYPDGSAIAADLPFERKKTSKRRTNKKGEKTAIYRKRPDTAGVVRLLYPLMESCQEHEVTFVLENVFPREQGKEVPMTAFQLGHAKGLIESLIVLAEELFGGKTAFVTPAQWRPVMCGTGAPKEVAIRRAQLLYPSADIRLKKHEHRAEALLIADFFRRKELEIGYPEFKSVKKVKKVKKTARRPK